MKFIDEIELHAASGAGGDGVVRWHSQRSKPRGGPAGGNGGRGGDVYVRGVRDIARLSKYRGNNRFIAEDGGDGSGDSLHGKNGEDLVIDVPVGSIVHIRSTGDQVEILNEDQQVRILVGGAGGLGNEHFKSSRNVTPRESTTGKPGQESVLYVELQLIAEAAFIGLPSAGKSSLLNALTNSKAKVGAYSFTTLHPNLGDLHGHTLADIPGLIEGASEGKGLGHKFLKHINRCKIALHCISAEQGDIKGAYGTVRNELSSFSDDLGAIPEYVVITKSDLLSEGERSTIEDQVKRLGVPYAFVSIIDDEALKELSDNIIAYVRDNRDQD